MGVGRNDPCPCGSGKKYKYCCLRKDQEAERARRREEREASAGRPTASIDDGPADPSEPKAPPDPHIEAINARWKEFEAADYEGRIALFRQTLEEQTLMDDEMAVEMLSSIYSKALKRDERDRWDGLVMELRDGMPDVYRQSQSYYLEWLLTNALVEGRADAVRSLGRELAETAGEDIDIFNNVVDRLAYHGGYLSTLVEMMRLAWPRVQESDNIVSWGVDEFCMTASRFEIFHFLEGHRAVDASDPELVQRLDTYIEVDPDGLPHYLANLTGQTDRQWTMRDLKPSAQPPGRHAAIDDEPEEAPVDEGKQALFDLTVEFLGYLRRKEGVPYTKGELARERIFEYIRQRDAGELVRRESMFEQARREAARRPQPERRQRKPDHRLCPDRETLDIYLGRQMPFMNPQYYKVAATFELVPAWLRFLETRGLIDAERREKTLHDLRGLDTQLLEVLDSLSADPMLREGTEQWRERAELEPPA